MAEADTVVCLITTPQPDAQRIASVLVERKLAACVNVVPLVQSVYWWEGSVQQDDEALLVVKTTRVVVKDIGAVLTDIHPYDNFELISLDIAAGSAPYLDWIGESVQHAR